MLSGCMPGEIRPTIGQQMETGDQRFGDLVFRQLAPNVWQHTSYLDSGLGQSLQRFDRQGMAAACWWSIPPGPMTRPPRSSTGSSRRSTCRSRWRWTHASGQDGRHGRAACGGIATYANALSNQLAPQEGMAAAQHKARLSPPMAGRTSNRAQLWPAQGILPRPRPHQRQYHRWDRRHRHRFWWLPDQGQQGQVARQSR